MFYIATLASIMGVILSLGYYFQAYSIIKIRSAEGVSLASYLIFAFGTLTWLVYGIALRDLSIITGFFFGVIGSWLVLILALKYRAPSVAPEKRESEK